MAGLKACATAVVSGQDQSLATHRFPICGRSAVRDRVTSHHWRNVKLNRPGPIPSGAVPGRMRVTPW
jgi:hypothetical protein